MALINNIKANKGVIGGWGRGSEVFIYLNGLNGHTEFHTPMRIQGVFSERQSLLILQVPALPKRKLLRQLGETCMFLFHTDMCTLHILFNTAFSLRDIP